jgi:putative phosphoribosyl transferase
MNSTQLLHFPVDDFFLEGELVAPAQAKSVVLFVHGSGSSRFSPRNQYVAQVIRSQGIATLLFDLLTRDEEQEDAYTGHLRFNISLLARRLETVTEWILQQSTLQSWKIGYFGASTGGGAALMAAAELGNKIQAVVSRGGRPDLAMSFLPEVVSPTLLIVGGNDEVVIELNQKAFQHLVCEKELAIVSGATHLFEEPGKLEEVARLAAEWFACYLT